MTVLFITESWHTDVSKLSPKSKYFNEWNTGSRNTKVLQGKVPALEVRKPNWLLILALPLLCSVILGKPQSFFGWSINELLLFINHLKRSFWHRQHTSLRLTLSPRSEKLQRPTVCSIIWETQHPPSTSRLCCQQPPSPLVYLIPPDEAPRINHRWAAEHFNESRA